MDDIFLTDTFLAPAPSPSPFWNRSRMACSFLKRSSCCLRSISLDSSSLSSPLRVRSRWLMTTVSAFLRTLADTAGPSPPVAPFLSFFLLPFLPSDGRAARLSSSSSSASSSSSSYELACRDRFCDAVRTTGSSLLASAMTSSSCTRHRTRRSSWPAPPPPAAPPPPSPLTMSVSLGWGLSGRGTTSVSVIQMAYMSPLPRLGFMSLRPTCTEKAIPGSTVLSDLPLRVKAESRNSMPRHEPTDLTKWVSRAGLLLTTTWRAAS
mmetsp:Transcript_33656/g.97078  ORF Transcript_33656/g.97078 Transcript_33656/m.97078 type:complete len:264 (-) Transcript_33656:1111-1902(-)